MRFEVIQQVGWLLWGIVVIVFLVIFIEIGEISIAIVVIVLPLGAVMGEVSLLPALEACIVSCAAQWSLSISYLSSDCISFSPSSSIVWSTGAI